MLQVQTIKNNELPLKIRVCKDKKSRYFNLGVFVKPEHWDFDNNRPKETRPDKEMLESLISNKINEARSKIVKLKAGYKGFSATSLIEKLSKDPTCDSRRIVQERDKFIKRRKEDWLCPVSRTGVQFFSEIQQAS